MGRCGCDLPQTVLGLLYKGRGGHCPKSGDDDEEYIDYDYDDDGDDDVKGWEAGNHEYDDGDDWRCESKSFEKVESLQQILPLYLWLR